ncbi:related to retrotransposon protein [Ustilago sp. UG-2017b]|nr:related to retrotransposon protein [Ustilago sp. UG-2017b]
MDEGARVILDPTGGQIHLANGMLLKIAKDRERGLLEFRGNTWRQSAMTISTPLFEGVDEEFELANRRPKISTKQLWHEHLGHPGRDKSRAIVDKLKGESVIALDPDTALTCEQCIQSKSTVAWMGRGSGERAAGPLDLIHIDLTIDSSHVTEYTCTLVLVNDYSKYVHAQPLLRKSHTFTQLKRIVSFLETQMDRKLKAIRSDQGTEWKSNEALEWSLSKGIEWQTTVGYNSRQNGQVERMNRSLGEKMRTLLMQRSLPKRFWPHAIRAAAFKLNLTPSVDREFPYQLMFRRSPE